MNGKIVVVGLRSSLFKDLGVFVEKNNEKNIYTFWIDTEAYPELDTNIVNKDIYIKLFDEIEQMTKKSENISAWSFDKSVNIDDLLEFSCSRVGDRIIYIYNGK